MNKKIEYRAYCFTNMYLSQIQRGIQSAHALVDMCQMAQVNSANIKIIGEWGAYHKTMIVLNGGQCEDLRQLYSYFQDVCGWFNLPLSKFEENESLNNAITCVSIILPSFIYDRFTYADSNMVEMHHRVNALKHSTNYTQPIEKEACYNYEKFIMLHKKIKQYKLA